MPDKHSVKTSKLAAFLANRHSGLGFFAGKTSSHEGTDWEAGP
jgi:hypothetical protein